MITRDEILMGREEGYPLSPELSQNLKVLLHRVNQLRQRWGRPMIVTSGYRPGHFNTLAKGATQSKHLSCQAVDFRDTEGELDHYLMNSPEVLTELGLWLEHPDDTVGWTHVQIVPPPLGDRIFRARARLVS